MRGWYLTRGVGLGSALHARWYVGAAGGKKQGGLVAARAAGAALMCGIWLGGT